LNIHQDDVGFMKAAKRDRVVRGRRYTDNLDQWITLEKSGK